MEKIILLFTASHLSDRVKKRFGIDFFLNNNFKVIVFDLHDYFYPEPGQLEDVSTYSPHPNLDVFACNKFNEIKNIINSSGEGVALLAIPNGYDSVKIKKCLQLNNMKVGTMYVGMLPFGPSFAGGSFSAIKRKFKMFKRLTICEFFKKVINKCYIRFFDISHYDFLITNNYETALLNYSNHNPISIIETHSWDYDLTLENKNSLNKIGHKYVVFLDQYLFDHPDIIKANLKVGKNKKEYYDQLNAFFSKIESNTNYKVIISAHPAVSSSLCEYKKLFQGREVTCGNSVELVKFSEFVLSHCSTANSFAVIYNKPILFLINDDLEDSDIGNDIKAASLALASKPINISQSYEIKTLLENLNIDSKKYADYKYRYIKKNNNECYSCEIFHDNYIVDLIHGR